jgi:hypothetical protein
MGKIKSRFAHTLSLESINSLERLSIETPYPMDIYINKTDSTEVLKVGATCIYEMFDKIDVTEVVSISAGEDSAEKALFMYEESGD